MSAEQLTEAQKYARRYPQHMWSFGRVCFTRECGKPCCYSLWIKGFFHIANHWMVEPRSLRLTTGSFQFRKFYLIWAREWKQ